MRSTTGPAGSTPLDDEELADLIPTHLTTRAQLNAWEQANINDAIRWVQGRRIKPSMLDVDTLMNLHRRMFGSTWRWAGELRTTAKNIGVPAHTIAEQLGNLVADVGYWIRHGTYPLDEIAVRYHHRLVSIHMFPNGNGRHARLATDLLLESVDEPRFTWGSANPGQGGYARARYLSSLREADHGQLSALMAFVRS
jgi:Fic-DOC domain mobile mystery protein B